MSFLMADLITVAVIENRLQYLADHPDHINWMLRPFVCNPALKRLVDVNYVAQCVDMIVNNRPIVRPLNDADMNKIPSIIVASNQGETQQFIGDQGIPYHVSNESSQSIIRFKASAIKGTEVFVSQALGVQNVTWPGLYLKSGTYTSKVRSVRQSSVDPLSDYIIELSSDLPSDAPLGQCSIETSPQEKWYDLHASVDSVKVLTTLTTSGDVSVHRLMSTVLRYCLKSGRSLFDAYGMQVASFSQQPIIIADAEQLIWQTSFSVDAKIADHWIDSESGLVGAPTEVEVTPSRFEGDDES
jgi:hypothetical protein